jgi:hypothetical protein
MFTLLSWKRPGGVHSGGARIPARFSGSAMTRSAPDGRDCAGTSAGGTDVRASVGQAIAGSLAGMFAELELP